MRTNRQTEAVDDELHGLADVLEFRHHVGTQNDLVSLDLGDRLRSHFDIVDVRQHLFEEGGVAPLVRDPQRHGAWRFLMSNASTNGALRYHVRWSFSATGAEFLYDATLDVSHAGQRLAEHRIAAQEGEVKSR